MSIFYITMSTQKRRGKRTISKRKAKSSRKKRTVRRRKMKGGVSFNDPVNPSNYPSYPLNMYNGGDPRNDMIDSRLLQNMTSGGRKKVSRRNRTKRSRRRRRHKMKGGSLMGTDLLSGLTTSTSNEMSSFGTTGGTNLMYDKITGSSIPDGPALHTERVMVPIA
jgi:hypothetical protein